MGLLRNSVIVGVATTLAGVGLMELVSDSPLKTPKPSWYVQATLLTGVAGAIGYALVNNPYTPEAVELNAQSLHEPCFTCDGVGTWDDGNCVDCEGSGLMAESSGNFAEFFSAEVFEADRKLRRRTRWTWARGFEKPKTVAQHGFDQVGFDNYATRDEYEQATGYEIDEQYRQRNWPHRYQDVFTYEPQSTYHISDLPEGYRLHLWKPQTRAKEWMAFAKSPSMGEHDWESFEHDSKSGLTADLLEWYNQDIARPETAKLNPLQRLAIAKGLKSGKVQIKRVEHPKVEKEIEDKDDGTISYKTITPHLIEYFASGGPDQLEPQVIAQIKGGSPTYIKDITSSHLFGKYDHVFPFLQGLSFMGYKKAGDNRSVNRFNKDSSSWPNVYHAWFKNVVENGIRECKISGKDNYDNQVNSWSSVANVQINGNSVIRFLNGERINPHYFRDDKTENWQDDGFSYRRESKNVTVYDIECRVFEVWTDKGWHRPRNLTQAKLYEGAMEEQLDGNWKINKFNFVNLVADKYRFEKTAIIKDSMISGELDTVLYRSNYKNTTHLMCRRFKKN